MPLVFVEQRGGKIHGASLQAITAARTIAGAEPVDAILIGENIAECARTVAALGVRRVYVAERDGASRYNASAFARVVTEALSASGGTRIVAAATCMGRDFMPRVAARLGAAYLPECTSLKDDSGAIVAKRSMYSGKAIGEFRAPPGNAVITVRANAFATPEAGSSVGETVALSASPNETEQRATVEQVVATGSGEKDVLEADVIVAGGRSLKSAEGFAVLEELAKTLDGAVGASLAAVDAGYQPHARQIGLTGKVVSPRLYFACGIDGAIQHLAGIRGSKVIVAINTNKDAPIFGVATYGCVADQFQLVPEITKQVRALGSGS